jgi:hypothetical protein
MFNNFFFENRAVYEIMWKCVLQQDRPQLTIWRMRIAYSTATNTLSRVMNTHRFPTTTMVARTRLNIMLYVHCLL